MKSFIRHLFIIMLVLSASAIRAQQFTNFTTANGLPSDNVNGVAIDGNNHKWFATQAGVARYNDTTWTIYTTANGLIDNYINCIAVDVNNHIWAGTDYGVSTFDGTRWISYTKTHGLVDNTVNYIAGDPDGSVWIGTGAGASNFDGINWHTYTTANGLPNDLISYIAVDQSGNKWFGTFIGGLSKFNGTSFTNFSTADSLPDNNIISIAMGANKTKWIGTYSGVAVFDSLDQWTATYRVAQGLLNNFVQDMAMDSKGTMWFGLYDIYVMDGGITKNNKTFWRSFTLDDGLINALVKRVAVDKTDMVWITTGGGVSKLYDPTSGAGELAGININLFPNPATTELHLNGMSTAGNLRIMTSEGKTAIVKSLSKGSNTINLQGLAPGIYIVNYTTTAGSYSGKLVIR
jgi:ligand-binding sensor domain-containing protein